MSENGPREGTRDLPKRDPDAARRSVDADSRTGAAYESQARQELRRQRALRELAREGLAPEAIAARYERDHPFERSVTPDELDRARGGAAPVPTPRHGRG